MTLASKIVVLRAGRVEQVGPPLQLYEDPDNQFVAGFIGSPRMNFLSVTVGPDGQTLSFGGTTAPAPTLTTKLQPGRRPRRHVPPLL